MSKILRDDDKDNDDAWAIAIAQVFSKNSQAKIPEDPVQPKPGYKSLTLPLSHAMPLVLS